MKIIGHRGARGLAPENTIAGLKKCLEHKVDEVEFDLRVTKDQVVILHHHAYLKDPNGNKLKIAKSSYKELVSHKADLATLAEVLDTIGNKVPLYIEVKPGVELQPIVKLIKAYLDKGWRATDFMLASFSQKDLLELHKDLPEVQKIVNERWSGVRASIRARQLGTTIVSMDQRWLWWGFIKSVSRRGWKLYAYTLNNPKKARRWERYGLYAAITDYPDRF